MDMGPSRALNPNRSNGDAAATQPERADESADIRVLRMIQLADSFFPSGSFTLSHGMESWLQNRSQDPSAEELRDWIQHYLEREILPGPAVILTNAYRLMNRSAIRDLQSLDRFYRSILSSEERRESTVKEGRSVREIIDQALEQETFTPNQRVREAWTQLHETWGTSGGTLPVTMGMVGVVLELESRNITSVYLYTIGRTITAAAVRLGVLDHFNAQSILSHLIREIPDWFERIADHEWARASSYSPRSRLLALEHEGADLRLFST